MTQITAEIIMIGRLEIGGFSYAWKVVAMIVADTYIFILCIGLSAIGAVVIYFCTRDDDPADKIAQERQEILFRLSELHNDREFSDEVFVGHEVSIRREAEIDEEKSKLMARLKDIEKEMGLRFDDDLW